MLNNRKLVGVLSALLILCLVWACPGLSEGTQSGTLGDLTWTLEDGLLTISGTGAMADFTAADPAPWHESAASITRADIGAGVQNIGANAFDGVPGGLQLTIADAALNLNGKVPANTAVTQGDWQYTCVGTGASARITGWTGTETSSRFREVDQEFRHRLDGHGDVPHRAGTDQWPHCVFDWNFCLWQYGCHLHAAP